MKYTNRDVKEFRNYFIECYSYETQYNWGHIVEISRKDTIFDTIARNKITYYNRTWECYRYQSCILGAICQLIEDRKKELIDDWKLQHNIKRASASEKEMAIADDLLLAEYREMYEHFKNL